MTTKPSFRADFKTGEDGKTSVYMARWVNTRSEKGPWSEVTTATASQAKFKSPQPPTNRLQSSGLERSV
jgi:hypothetical protein